MIIIFIPEWVKEVKKDLKHFYEMAKFCCFSKSDKHQFWEYVVSYANVKIERIKNEK